MAVLGWMSKWFAKSGTPNLVSKGRMQSSFLAHFPEGVDASALTDGFARLTRFYADTRALDAMSLEEDGDMLLVQYGTYDRGNGSEFEMSFTRQVIYGDFGDNHEIWQLQLAYFFETDAATQAFGNSDAWCHHPVELATFISSIIALEAFQSAAIRQPTRTLLVWEEV